MNVFKLSYKIARKHTTEIYKGFGFRHLSDATHYYVHPNNQSFQGTTTLCQPIGEAVILFADFLVSIMNGEAIGDFYYTEDRKRFYLEIFVPEEYRLNQVVTSNIMRYRVVLEEDRVLLAAYNAFGQWLDSTTESMEHLYKLLPIFLGFLARDMEQSPDLRKIMEELIENPAVDTFVNVHEDFYQSHKLEEISIEYTDLSYVDIEGLRSFSSQYEIIRKNKAEQKKSPERPIGRFAEDCFTTEQKRWIPNLSAEFVLPAHFAGICNAIISGDMLAILFHGPAGTGKTMSCKLIAQQIGLPILETVNCTENLDEFILGKYIPQEDKIIFKESYVTKAIREGGAVVFEEINFAKPQYLAFLNSLLDDNGFVRLDNGEVVYRHPNFRFFATMNLGYFGTKELNQALYNRFQGIIEIATLSDQAISRMLIARVPECKPVVDKLLAVYHKVKKKIESEELELVISPRNLENWARLAKYEGYLHAAEKTIIPIAKGDKSLEEMIRGMLMLYRWNPQDGESC